MHAHQLAVPVVTVRRLVDDQFPEWRDLAILPVASHGTVNAIFRIGEHLCARFPLKHLRWSRR
jgi:aminoglycoside phosphotransferase (APT) family kinase protein